MKTTIFAKKRACDALRRPATSCDVFCDACDVFCDALRRFLRRPATSCDALRRFLAVFGRFCHFWPCLSHILENKGKRPKISGLMFGFSQVWWESGQGSLWQRLCCCTVCQNQIESLWWYVCSISRSNTESASFQFSEAPLAAILAKFRPHVKANVFYPGLLDLSQWLPCRGKEWFGGEGYMLDELSKIGSFKSLQNPDTFSEEPMLRAFCDSNWGSKERR